MKRAPTQRSRITIPRALTALCLSLCLPLAQAATSAAEQQRAWATAARASSADFVPSAARGKTLFEHAYGKSAEMPSCASCHTRDPQAQGKHAVTGKSISPLSPLANTDRFSDAAKSEKWFKRNCNDVIGRECTPAEKADLVEYLIKGAK